MTKGCGKKYFDKDLNEELYCDWSTICPECLSQEICKNCDYSFAMHTAKGLDKVGFTDHEYAWKTMGVCKKFKPKTQETPNHSLQSDKPSDTGFQSVKQEGTSKSQDVCECGLAEHWHDWDVLNCKKFKPKTQETPNHSPQTKQEEYSPNTNPAGYRSSDKEPSDKTEDTSKSQDKWGRKDIDDGNEFKTQEETLSDNGLTLKEIDNLLPMHAKDIFYHEKKLREFIAKIKKRVDDVTTLIYTRAMMKVMIDLEAGKGLI